MYLVPRTWQKVCRNRTFQRSDSHSHLLHIRELKCSLSLAGRQENILPTKPSGELCEDEDPSWFEMKPSAIQTVPGETKTRQKIVPVTGTSLYSPVRGFF